MQLQVRPISADINWIADQDWFTKMDPYVVCRTNGSSARTRTHHNGGRKPRWNDTLSLLAYPNDMIVFEIWDKDTFTSDDFVASATLPVQQVMMSKQYTGNLNLVKRGTPVGMLNVSVTCSGSMPGMMGGMGMGGMGMGMGMGGMGMGMGMGNMGMGNMGMGGMGMGGMGMGTGNKGMENTGMGAKASPNTPIDRIGDLF